MGSFFKKLFKIPLGFFILFGICQLILKTVNLTTWPTLYRTLEVSALLALYFGIIRIVAFIIVDYIIGTKKAIAVPAITRDLILFIIYTIVVMIVLRQKLNVDITSLVATSAVLTAIVGLALQDTLGNLFSGLALNIEKPYKLGDWVAFDKYRGQVKGVNWRSTILLTAENETIVVPNNVISKSHIVNFSDPSTLVISNFFIGIEYKTSPNQVRDVIFTALRSHPEVLADREMEVRLTDYSDFAIKYEVRYWVDIQDDYESSERIKSEIMTQLWYAFRREGIKIPFPIRVQHRAEETSPEEIKNKMESQLGKIELFSPLNPTERQTLAQAIKPLEFAEGEKIVHQATPGETMYVIAKGLCAVQVRDAYRNVKVVGTLQTGDFFGEMSCLTGAERTATVLAKTDVLLYEIAKQDMEKILLTNPEISTRLSELLAKRETERAKTLSEMGSVTLEERPPSAKQILQKIKAFFRMT